MKLIGVRQTLLAAGLVVGASCCACSRHATATHSAALKTKPSAEESFQLIFDTFKRRIEETPIGFVSTDPSRRTTMIGRNEVSSELIRPTNPADPFKAVVTVASESTYSIKRMTDKDNANERADNKDKNGKTQGDDLLTDTDGKNGADAFDPTLNSKPVVDSKSFHAPDDAIARRPDKKFRKYELLYQNGRWTLVTELNKETEQSIQNAFRSALETQI